MSTIQSSMAPTADDAKASVGILRRAFRCMVEARSRSAERLATVYLQGMSDERLSTLGLSANEIAALRKETIDLGGVEPR